MQTYIVSFTMLRTLTSLVTKVGGSGSMVLRSLSTSPVLSYDFIKTEKRGGNSEINIVL